MILRTPYRIFVLLGLSLFLVTTVVFFNGSSISEREWSRAFLEEKWDKEDEFIVSDGSKRLPTEGSLFCFVITSPKYHSTRVPAVNATWLPKCDHGEFFTNIPRPGDPDYNLMNGDFSQASSIPFSFLFNDIPDQRQMLFWKSLDALAFVYRRFPDFDWYYKADDDTFVVVENLRRFLATLDPSLPQYVGYRMRPYLRRGYNSGGAGYVLSREALRLFNERLLLNGTRCPFNADEDVGVGKCFESLGIYPVDTRNEKGKQRFNAYNASDISHKRISDQFDPQIMGFDAVAPQLISIHHLSPDEIRTYYHLVYNVGLNLAKLPMND